MEKFLYSMRNIKIQQRKLTENSNALIDFGKIHSHLSEKIEENREEQQSLAERVEVLDEKLNQLVQMMQELPRVIAQELSHCENSGENDEKAPISTKSECKTGENL